jgi:hypothetical protein
LRSHPEFSINVLSQSSGPPGQLDCIFDFPQAIKAKPGDILDIQLLIQNENVQPNSGYELSLGDLPGATLWSIGGLAVKPRITGIAQTVVAAITVIAVLRGSPGNGRTNM